MMMIVDQCQRNSECYPVHYYYAISGFHVTSSDLCLRKRSTGMDMGPPERGYGTTDPEVTFMALRTRRYISK